MKHLQSFFSFKVVGILLTLILMNHIFHVISPAFLQAIYGFSFFLIWLFFLFQYLVFPHVTNRK